MPAIHFENVSKVYDGNVRALTDCTFEVLDGELLVIVGPSGCGKSTLLRLLAGLESVTTGTIRIGDAIANEMSPQERNVAMVFQDYALYPHMTVAGNLEFPLKMRRLPRSERRRRVERVAALLEMGDLLERLPRQLSGGQRQRVAMGRALVREPSAFLLDEPLSNLDARLRAQVRTEIADLQRRIGATMLYVTHDQVEALTLGQRIAVLHQGRLQQIGTPRDLYERPVNVLVAGFIGNPPMNLFPAGLSRVNAHEIVLTLAGQRLRIRMADRFLDQLEDTSLIAGVRPEGLKFATNPQPEQAITVQIENMESLGHETLVRVHTPGADRAPPISLTLRTQGFGNIARGDTLRLAIDPAALRLFDQEGQALL